MSLTWVMVGCWCWIVIRTVMKVVFGAIVVAKVVWLAINHFS